MYKWSIVDVEKCYDYEKIRENTQLKNNSNAAKFKDQQLPYTSIEACWGAKDWHIYVKKFNSDISCQE